MLIVIKESIDVQYAVVGAAHASLAGYLEWEDEYRMQEWVNGVFNKHIKIATPEEFEKAKSEKYGEHLVITESNLVGEEVAIVYNICEEYPSFLRTLPKWNKKLCSCPVDSACHEKEDEEENHKQGKCKI